jgi:uncharacterized protein YecT (DUF1311 family)
MRIGMVLGFVMAAASLTGAQTVAPLADRGRLLQQGAAVFDREMAREKAGDCPDASNTFDINQCLVREVETTTANYKAYASSIRALIELNARQQDADPFDGPTGRPPSADERLKEFDRAEAAWATYEQTVCTVVYHIWQGGTGAPSAEAYCHLGVTRDHIRELGRTIGSEFLR